MASVLSSRTGNLSFVDLIDRYVPVQSSLLRQLEIRDIIALSRTCKRLRHVYDTTIRTQYNINDALKPYFTSPLEFRKVQAEIDAILCDDTALCFFLRKPLTQLTGCLRIFVERGSSTDRMRTFLLEDGWVECQPAIVDPRSEVNSVARASKKQSAANTAYRLTILKNKSRTTKAHWSRIRNSPAFK
jgi:hypothetical protein